jgi:acetyl-CoA carboxylase/biotin carboxylase 1
MLRQVENFNDRLELVSFPEELVAVLKELVALKGKANSEIVLAADNIIRQSEVPPFDNRVAELRAQLLDPATDFVELSRSPTLSAGVDLLTYLFNDDDAAVRKAAVEVYTRRVYRAHKIQDIEINEENGRITCAWSFRFADIEIGEALIRHGHMSVIPSLDKLATELPSILDKYANELSSKSSTDEAGGPVNVLHIAAVSDELSGGIDSMEKAIVGQKDKLKMLGVRTVNTLLPVSQKEPLYYTFPYEKEYSEDPLRRNMRPTFHHILELPRVIANFDLERLPAIGKNAQVYVGTEKDAKPVRGGPPQVVFVRGLSHMPGLVTEHGAKRALMQGLDELERAQANSKVSDQSSSRIFLHSLVELDGTTPEQVAVRFQEIMGRLKSQLAQRLLKLRVDEIEVKVRIPVKSEGGEPVLQSVRLVASSMEGEWLKPTAYLEKPDPITGVTQEYCIIGEEAEMCFLDPYSATNVVQTKRAIARRVGSTYAYDFLGLMEVGLIGEWDAYLKTLPADSRVEMPSNLFEAEELFENENGELVPGSRPIGTNKIGMVAWTVKMKTPEYPEGREVVVIANDVTVQSGSFGVQEDELYYKASVYARERKLPRLYLACNAGARIGLVDELKPKLQIKFVDEANPSKGFEYLYLRDEDYQALPEGAVIAHKVPEGWALDDVIGTEHGIGVENLQGSGKIAGETSKAYDEIFTLSYVTGRSVGIGAYLVRLGQRVIQMQQGPIILTGYSALNKLLGREVYTSQDQLGGPQIMVPNGVTHETVSNDQEGVASILKWLSFVPKEVGALPASRSSGDPIDRDVAWRPTPTPYDPRLMMAGTSEMPGFFDEGTFKEYLAGWGKSVVIGRGRLGGIPMGAIAVETRLVDKVIPADPADPNSREAVQPQAGQVLFPDSSYKTAQAIRDFDKEGLPIMIFANWRGFSGGSRDMAGEILK